MRFLRMNQSRRIALLLLGLSLLLPSYYYFREYPALHNFLPAETLPHGGNVFGPSEPNKPFSLLLSWPDSGIINADREAGTTEEEGTPGRVGGPARRGSAQGRASER